MQTYKINKISQIEKNLLSDFYKKTYHKRYKSLTSNWRWWYRADHTEYEPLILSIDNKVIGQAGLLPVDLNLMGNKVSAIYFVDFAILAEYQGKGFGQILTKEWMKICPNQITFCNDKSLKVFQKFGWKNNLSTKRLARPINLTKFFPIIKSFKFDFLNSSYRYFIKKKYNQNSLIQPYMINNNFKVINDSFKKKKNINVNNFAEIIRDEKWLYWRLMECPYNKDIYFFEYKGNIAIVHIFKSENIKKLNILYTYFTQDSNFEELFIKIINWSINNNIDLVWAINRNVEFNKAFPKVFNKSINFASWSSDEKISNILEKGLSNSQAIDSDIDSNLYIE